MEKNYDIEIKKEKEEVVLSDDELMELVGGAKRKGSGLITVCYGIFIPFWKF